MEVYGESRSRPLFSAEFDLAPAARRLAGAFANCGCAPDTAPRTLEEMLPKPDVNPVENDLSRNALPYATALAGACPRLAPAANVLPPEASALQLAGGLHTDDGAGRSPSPGGRVHGGVRVVEREAVPETDCKPRSPNWSRCASAPTRWTVRPTQARARAQLLDQFRKQTRMDLDALNELTQADGAAGLDELASRWSATSVRIGGDAPQTSPLVKILDSSPFFEKTEIQMSTPKRQR